MLRTALAALVCLLVVSAPSPVPRPAPPSVPADPAAPAHAAAVSGAGSLYLVFEGDALAVRAVFARKNPHAFRALRVPVTEHRLRLLGANGTTLAEIPVDLAGFCLDPAHRGDPPHVAGCVARSHAVAFRACVPDDARTAKIVFEQLAAERWVERSALDAAALVRKGVER